MIERYTLPAYGKLFSEQSKFQRWLEVEAALARAIQTSITAKQDVYNRFTACKEVFSVDKVKELERVTRHDVAAFLLHVDSLLSEDLKPFLHRGLTSSDVVDTALAMTLQAGLTLVVDDFITFRGMLCEFMEHHKSVSIVTRTHGQHAGVLALSDLMAPHLHEVNRCLYRLLGAREEISYGKLSGPFGDNRYVSRKVEFVTLNFLGLSRDLRPTQVIPRDRHASMVFALAQTASCIERFALNVRLRSQTGIDEIHEGFVDGQIGSSSMPHKRNPISSENLCGVARLVRSYVAPAMENCALWNERDISHSSVEREILPNAVTLVGYMCRQAGGLVRALTVDRSKCRDAAVEAPNSFDELEDKRSEGLSYTEAYEAVRNGI